MKKCTVNNGNLESLFESSFCSGLKKRGNSWFASYYVAGKQLVKTTGIPIVPAAIPPGKTKAAMMKQNEASARLITQELEKAVYGQQVDHKGP